MPVSKGIDVQKSRFAALALETSSESEEDAGGEWEKVKKTAHKPGKQPQAAKKGNVSGTQLAGQEGESRQLSKNAKKRARKRRQHQQQAQAVGEVRSGRQFGWLNEATVRVCVTMNPVCKAILLTRAL